MPNKIKIMIIEDEDAISNFIATTLKANAYAPLLAKTAGQALSMIPSHCSSDLESDKVEALDLGADDYISKPFGTSELLARIRTALRHSAKNNGGAVNNDVFSTKGLTIDFDKRKITVDGKDVHLTQIEFKIVSLLAKSAGRVLTYDYIITELWGPYAVKDNQILRVNMANIRRKLEKNPASPEYIFTEVGIGYRMVDTP